MACRQCFSVSEEKTIDKGRGDIIHSLNKKMSGVITVEATIIIPLFVLAIMGFISLIHIIYVQMCVQSSINYATMSMQSKGVVYEYLYETLDEKADEVEKKLQGFVMGKVEILDNDLFKKAAGWVFKEIRATSENKLFEIIVGEAVVSHLKELNTDYSCFVGDINDIDFSSSTMNYDTGEFMIVADYELKIPVVLSKSFKFKITQNARGRIFGGTMPDLKINNNEDTKNQEGEEEVVVYVTETGEVYHKDKNCVYLTNRMQKVQLRDMDSKRSNSGEIYYPCDRCGGVGELFPEREVYYSQEGARYHTSLHCPVIVRKITELNINEVKDKRECTKCG